MLTYKIYTRDFLPDAAYVIGDWTPVDQSNHAERLYLIELTAAVAPAYTTAKIAHYYGNIAAGGKVQASPSINLLGKFVLIRILDDNGGAKDYVFTCQAGSDDIYGAHANPLAAAGKVKPGASYYDLYDLSWFLARQTIDKTITDKGNIATVLDFNAQHSDRREQILGNRSAAKSGDSYVFTTPTGGSSKWTAADVIEYALRLANDAMVADFAIFGTTGALVNYDDIVSAGGSIRDLIARILSPDRGYVWWTENQDILVTTQTDVDIFDGATLLLPANTIVTDLDLTDDEAYETPRVNHLESAHYSTVSVRGERLRVLATFKASEVLASDWDATDASNYNAAAPEELERPEYEHVFRRFRIPDPWNGYRDAAAGDNAWPAWDATLGTINPAAQQTKYFGNLVLDRSIPLEDPHGHERKPFCLVANGGEYWPVHKPPKGDHVAAGLRILDDAPGIYIDPPYGHLFAIGSYTGAHEEKPLYDWDDDLILTASYYTPEVVRVDMPVANAPSSGIDQTKVIYLPDHHFWWQAPNTVVGHKKDALVTEAAAATLRDDTPAMRRLATLLAHWYGRRRAAIDLTYRQAQLVDRLGQYINEVATGGQVDPGGSVISRISYQFGQNDITVTLSTEFRDIDFQSLMRPPAAADARARNRSLGTPVGANPANLIGRQALANVDISAPFASSRESLPIKVTYDSSTPKFTIAVTNLRWVNPVNPTYGMTVGAQGLFADKSWDFSVPGPPSKITIGFVTTYVGLPCTQENATHELRFVDPDSIATDSTDAVENDGQFHALTTVTLNNDGTYSIAPEIGKPHVVARHEPPATESWLTYGGPNQLTLYNLGNGPKVDYTVPVSSNLELAVGYKRNIPSAPKIDDINATDWQHKPMPICHIETDSGGALIALIPYTQRRWEPQPVQMVICEMVSHTAGAKTATVKIWNGGYYDNPATPTVKTADKTSVTAHIIQLHDEDALAVGRLYLGRRLIDGNVEIIPTTLQ